MTSIFSDVYDDYIIFVIVKTRDIMFFLIQKIMIDIHITRFLINFL